MKKVLLLLTCLLACESGYSQFRRDPVLNLQSEDKKFLNWGYYLGFNQYDFKWDYDEDHFAIFSSLPSNQREVLVEKNLGFNVGLIGEMRINKFLDLRFEPGLFYSQRRMLFPLGAGPEPLGAAARIREARSTYIHFPLLLKVSALRKGNFKPFLIGGVSTSLNLGSNEQSPTDISGGDFRMRSQVYSYELGFGIDFYTPYFKFAPSIRGIFTMTDELVRDSDPNSLYTGTIASMRTRGIFVNLTFE